MRILISSVLASSIIYLLSACSSKEVNDTFTILGGVLGKRHAASNPELSKSYYEMSRRAQENNRYAQMVERGDPTYCITIDSERSKQVGDWYVNRCGRTVYFSYLRKRGDGSYMRGERFATSGAVFTLGADAEIDVTCFTSLHKENTKDEIFFDDRWHQFFPKLTCEG